MLAKGSEAAQHHPREAVVALGEGDSWTTAGRDRSLALAGIVFVVLILIAGFLPGSPPKPNDSAAKIVKFVTDKNDQLRWAGFVGVLASIVLLGWLGAVWRLLRRAEGGVVRLAVGAALGAAMAAALFNAAGVLMSTVAIVGAPSIGASDTRFFYLLFGGPRCRRRHRAGAVRGCDVQP